MILCDREIELALEQGRIIINPTPDLSLMDSTTVDLRLDTFLDRWTFPKPEVSLGQPPLRFRPAASGFKFSDLEKKYTEPVDISIPPCAGNGSSSRSSTKLAKDITAKHAKHTRVADLLALIDSAKNLRGRQDIEAEKNLIANDTILRVSYRSSAGMSVSPRGCRVTQQEYRRRNEGMIPPFCKMDDEKDKQRRMGDVVIWLELLNSTRGTTKAPRSSSPTT